MKCSECCNDVPIGSRRPRLTCSPECAKKRRNKRRLAKWHEDNVAGFVLCGLGSCGKKFRKGKDKKSYCCPEHRTAAYNIRQRDRARDVAAKEVTLPPAERLKGLPCLKCGKKMLTTIGERLHPDKCRPLVTQYARWV